MRPIVSKRLWAGWCLAALACLLAGGTGLAAKAEARPLVTGISGLFDYNPLALQQTRATGARFVRMPLAWASIAPASKPAAWNPKDPADPHYSWDGIDLAVKNTVEAGLTPLISIEGAPEWAQRCHLSVERTDRLCDPDPADLASFATAIATRYSGNFEGLPAVHYWQGLNEPNLSLYFNPQYEGGRPVSPDLYRNLANAFYAAIKAVDPENLVVMAGLGPIARPGLTIGPMKFTRLLLCMRGRRNPRPAPGNCGGGVRFDIFDMHPYTTGGPTHKGGPDDVEIGDLGKLKELLRAAGRAGRIKGEFRQTPIWITEFSWDSRPPDPGGLPMRIETAWMAEALHRAWLAGVTNFFWFGLTDFPREGRRSSENIESGLYFRGATLAGDRPKKVMYVFRFPFVANRTGSGFSFWGRTPTSTAGRVVIQMKVGRSWRRAAATHANGSGIFKGRVRTSYGRDLRGTVRASYGGENAIPFPLDPIKDFYQPPFGR